MIRRIASDNPEHVCLSTDETISIDIQHTIPTKLKRALMNGAERAQYENMRSAF